MAANGEIAWVTSRSDVRHPPTPAVTVLLTRSDFRMRVTRLVLSVALFSATALPAAAQPGQTLASWRVKNLQFQKSAPKPAVTAFGYYVGPFTGTVLSDPTRPTINLFCVDVLNQIRFGHQWTGVFTNLGSSDLSATRHGGSARANYQKAAWLASQYRAPGIQTSQWGGIQAAVWNLLNPGNPNGGTNPLASSSEAYWLARAETWYNGGGAQAFDFSRWSIVTDIGAAGLVSGGGTQEFLTDTTVTPEPETLILLGTGLLVVLGIAMAKGVIRL